MFSSRCLGVMQWSSAFHSCLTTACLACRPVGFNTPIGEWLANQLAAQAACMQSLLRCQLELLLCTAVGYFRPVLSPHIHTAWHAAINAKPYAQMCRTLCLKGQSVFTHVP